MLRERAEEEGLLQQIGQGLFKRIKRATTRLLFAATFYIHGADEAANVSAARQAWWPLALANRAPILSGGDGTWHTQIFYGAASNYGLIRASGNPMSGAEYYEAFRFQREDIPRLVTALHIPFKFRTQSGCVISGEEGLLMYLKV